jgi:hypothetical protein
MESILTQFCKAANVKPDAVRGVSRVRHLNDARQMYTLLVRHLYSLNQIGEQLNRNHSSITHQYKTALDRQKNDSGFAHAYQQIQDKLLAENMRFDSYYDGQIVIVSTRADNQLLGIIYEGRFEKRVKRHLNAFERTHILKLTQKWNRND